MEDLYSRKINYLRLSVTDRCNMRCIYCMPEDGIHNKLPHADVLSVEEAVEIVKQAAGCGITKVRLTGGEPLVHKGIVEICRNISAIPEIKELCLTTNGVLLKKMAKDLKDAGVDRLNISIDTLQEDKYRKITRIGDLKTTLDGIAAAEEAGFKNIKLNVVLMGGINDDEIADFVNLTMDHDWEIRFIELMPMGECINWDKGAFISIDEVLKRCPDLKLVKTDGVATVYKLDGSKGAVGLISPISHSFCSKCNRIRVTSDGRLKPCLHSKDEIHLKGMSGDTLKNEIIKGISSKPMEHTLKETKSQSLRNMNRIGG